MKKKVKSAKRQYQTVFFINSKFLDFTVQELKDIANERIIEVSMMPWSVWGAGIFLVGLGILLLYFVIIAKTRITALNPDKNVYFFVVMLIFE